MNKDFGNGGSSREDSPTQNPQNDPQGNSARDALPSRPVTSEQPAKQRSSQDDELFRRAREEQIKQEEELVKRVSLGETQATERLYEMYLPIVYGNIIKRVRNEQDAQALTSDIFTRALESLLHGKYVPQGKPFGAWLSGIANNVYAEWKRKQHQKYSTTPLEALSMEQHPRTEEDALDMVLRQEQQQLGWQLIRSLPLIDQQIMLLRHQYRLSHAQIAQELNMTEAAVKQRHHRAQQVLRARLSQFEDWTGLPDQ